jgi:Fe2+ transport system protein FeoA
LSIRFLHHANIDRVRSRCYTITKTNWRGAEELFPKKNELCFGFLLAMTNIMGRELELTLRDLKVGQSGRVLSVGGERVLRRRLLEMGITPRTVIRVKKIAPMGDPIELYLRGYVLSLRLDDAGKITIEELSP